MSDQALAGNSRALAVLPRQNPEEADRSSRDVVLLPGLVIRLAEGRLIVLLTGKEISVAAESPNRRELIDRLFSIPALKSFRLNSKTGEVRLEFAAEEISAYDIVTSLASVMRGRRPPALPLPHVEVVLGDEGPPAFGISRAGPGLTLWQIDAPSTRFFRLAHPLLRFDYVRKQVLEELSTLSDVILRSIYLPIVGNEALIVFGRPHRIDPALFREVLDPVLTRCLASGPPQHRPKLRDVLVNANLTLAAITDFVFPPLGLANIALTGTLGAGYVPRALFALRQRKFTLELLYLVIAALTVITYEFLPAALMYWLMRYWPRRTRELYDSHHSRFIARYRLRPRRVWIDQAGTALETRVEDLTPASVVTLTAGDIVPGDGLVVDGSARCDERLLTGARNPVSKAKGSEIYAASRVVDGSVRIKISSLGDNTAVGRLARWHSEPAPSRAAESPATHRAETTVLPVLLATALAGVQGGLMAAKAAIRPDYVTGPALSEDLGRLATTIRAAGEGILIARNVPLEKLTGPVSVVFDDTVPWQTPQINGESFADLALAQGVEETAFFSTRSRNETARLAASLGFHSFHEGGSTAAKRDYITQRQREGHTVLYVGDCRTESSVAAQADLAIAVLEPPFHRLDHATVALLSPDLLKVLQLRALALDATAGLNTSFRISLVPNAAAVLGAFVLTAPVYASILLTTLGTFANYVRSETILHLSQTKVRK